MTATAAQHQAAQATIAARLTASLPPLWQLVDLSNLNDTLPTYSTAVAAMVRRYGRASAALAASFYEAQRRAASVPGAFRVALAPTAGVEQVSKGVDWATRGLWSATPNAEAAQTLIKGVAEKYALQPGRMTIITAANNDRQSTGWARQVEPGACSFCLLLATRGANYRSEQSADFAAHDHCHCHVEPLFGPYEPSAEVRQAQAIYRSVKGSARGPAAVRRAFRQAVEDDRAKSTAARPPQITRTGELTA